MANEITSKEELIKHLTNIVEDHEHDIKKARSPKAKRGHQQAHTFFNSIKHHLVTGCFDAWNEGYVQGQKDKAEFTGDNFHLNPYNTSK